MRIAFTKMHGNGNDFILFDEYGGEVVAEREKPNFVRAVCHRNFGIGADGVIFVQPSEKADVRFRYFNSDGSEAAMCGNGIRCFSRYVVEEGYAGSKLKVETLAGILELEVLREKEWWVRVDMGGPRFEKERIPSKVDVWGYDFEHDGRTYKLYAVNTGVPHAVIFVESLDFDVLPLARRIRFSEIFPEGTNVNFAKIEGEDLFRVRTYERGVEAETLSCGTGSVAVAAVARKLGIAGDKVRVVTRGGLLKVELTEKTAFLLGGASRVFDGILRLNELRYEV